MRPDLPLIGTSGLNEREALLAVAPNSTFLLKPFTTEQVLQAIQQAIHPPAAQP
jgi:CheY-like chemotaxis protein